MSCNITYFHPRTFPGVDLKGEPMQQIMQLVKDFMQSEITIKYNDFNVPQLSCKCHDYEIYSKKVGGQEALEPVFNDWRQRYWGQVFLFSAEITRLNQSKHTYAVCYVKNPHSVY